MLGFAQMSDPAVKYRLDKAVDFLDAVLAQQLAAKSAGAVVRWAGRVLRASDGTCIGERGSKTSNWRVHAVYDLGRGGFSHLELTDDRGAEAITRGVTGIDDWAWKRGHRYGTIICDLERRCIIDILPDREAATATAWLARHPSITVIARDRGAGDKQAATDGRPEAIQVADRWHLMENGSAAERRQHADWLHRAAENANILALSAHGVAIKKIMRRTDKSRSLVRQVVRGARADIFRSRMSSLDPFLTQLETAWAGGSHNGAALWRAMKAKGFTGSLRVVTEWATRKRKDERTAMRDKWPAKAPSARRIARMMTTERDKLSKAVARTIAIIGEAVPDLTTARSLPPPDPTPER